MPVPTSFADLSTTPASNSPAGSENVFPNLDDYIRFINGALASIKANTASNGWVSPYLTTSAFPASLAANGYQTLSSGVIIQWGSFTSNATPGAATAITFPIAFPATCSAVVPTAGNAGATTASAWFDTATRFGFNARTSGASQFSYFIAIGY